MTSLNLSGVDNSSGVSADGEAPLSFGRFSVFRQARQLFMDGKICEIGGRALDLLLVLIDRRGQVVSKREIIDRVWPDTYVDDINLRVQIVTLRRALGADRDIVKTVPGRGYLFAAEVSLPKADRERESTIETPDETPEVERDSAAARTNFTRHIHALLGRSAELGELEQLIGQSRMVTLTGCGGVGKTRLAIELGLRLTKLFPNGVFLIDLAPLKDRASIVSTTAAVLGVQILNPEMAVESIASVIGQRQLLIFDNCEHLVEDVSGFIEALLDRARGLFVLATSQEPLHHPLGSLYRVEPLAVPPLGAVEISTYAATALFCERARLADRRFKVTTSNTDNIAQICRRLDGIPLALEMAAARLPLLGIEGLTGALDARLKVLKTIERNDDARHHTLRSMVEWSHGLLDDAEQRIFRRVGIFPSSFSLEAAAETAGAEDEDYWDLVDTLGRLVDRSLVTVEGNDPPRYRLLETLRIFAREQLTERGEYHEIAQRHARYFADLLVASDQYWRQGSPAAWMQRYAAEFDSVQAALDWGIANPEHRNITVRMAGASSRLWLLSGRRAEGQRYLEQANRLVDDTTPPRDVARVFSAIGYHYQDIDNPRSRAALEQSAALYRKLDDAKLELASVLSLLGGNSARAGLRDEAKLVLDEALDILAFTDSKMTLFSVTTSLGQLARLGADNVGARRHFERALELARELKDEMRQTYLLRSIAEIEFAEGAVDRAIALAREATSRLRTNSGHLLLNHAVMNLASYLAYRGDPSEARRYAEEALLLERDKGGEGLWVCLQLWALLAALDGRYSEAARLIGFVDTAVAANGAPWQPTEQKLRDRLTEILDDGMPAADRLSCAAEGARWNEKWAVEFTMNHVVPRPSVRN